MTISRKIPTLMASQHPDNVLAPHWSETPYISTYHEPEDCYHAFKDLECDEYMWDWEGKLVDEAVFDRLIRHYHHYFESHPLGKDVFLTYRIPNISHEPGYRIARAYMGMLSAAEFAREINRHAPPVFEVILPMTESVEDLMRVQKTFHQTAKLKAEVFEQSGMDMEQVEVIPLFEGVDNLTESHEILAGYIEAYQVYHQRRPEYMRPFMARSDPALNSGIIATTLAIKIALSNFGTLQDTLGIPLYPIIGPGSLPFRGHLSPPNVEKFVEEYGGIRTAVLQSSFRFDWPEEEVKTAIRYLKTNLPQKTFMRIPTEAESTLREVIPIAQAFYRDTIEQIAPTINDISEHVPARRERMLHVGLLGYSRTVGATKLPRAIKFTSALYSLGIPPELIGLGRGLEAIKAMGVLDLTLEHYRNLKHDLVTAGYYLNRENLAFLAKENPAWADIIKDVTLTEQILEIDLGPRDLAHYIHRNSVSNIYFMRQNGSSLTKEIEWAAAQRHSLG